MTRLCPPSAIYFTISILILLCMFYQNINSNDPNIYKVGVYSKPVSSIMFIFLIKFTYIVFWTYILNLFCKDGNQALSWLVILFPFLLSFVVLGLFLLEGVINPFATLSDPRFHM